MYRAVRTRFAIAVISGMLLGVMVLSQSTAAAPPHPELLEATALEKKAPAYFMTHQADLRSAGLESGPASFDRKDDKQTTLLSLSPEVMGSFNVLAILVTFSDKPAATGASYFDDLLFSTTNVSVRHYYREASYAQLDIVTVNLPSSLGWVGAPQTYAYYVNGENGVNPDSYPNNAQRLVEDLVSIVDGSVNFSRYDNDNNGFVDVLMVVHAGPGAEFTGSDDDMWSHQWQITPRATNDGVYVSNYTMQPEYLLAAGDMTIGVFAHELGHAFGLPDLYDTDYSSNGIGSWGIMAFGSWLGPRGLGELPAAPCAWSRIQMGFNQATNVTSNVTSQTIYDVKNARDIYRLWTSGAIENEYFLVENRQRTGYDTYLPSDGLLIWHIDDTQDDNDNEWYPGLNPASHYLVALEQADGLFELEKAADAGDGNDPFPISGVASSFNALSAVTSSSYTDGNSYVSVENISPSGDSMTADFYVSFSGSYEGDTEEDDDAEDSDILPTSLRLSQNYPNPFNPTTTISFYSPDPGYAVVDIFDILGRRVQTLLSRDIAAGQTEIQWDGTNSSGGSVASGIYLCKLEMNGQKQLRKMILAR
ncbi:MAG: M6 family metalloprotease domain-containing protein [Candidatus Zixiibacteriota bacterium]